MSRALPLAILALASAAAGFLLYRGLADRAPATAAPSLPAASAPRPAEFVPEFLLPDLEGRPRSSREWHDTVRVVNFWATWCPPCIREIPLLVEVQQAYGERGVRVIGIAVDEMDAVAEFAADFEFNYPVLIGQEDAMELGNQFLAGFIGLPFTAFTDRDGRIFRVHVGEIHREQIEAILAELL
jgi:thiol-disulfide isomerase/thioredoxin